MTILLVLVVGILGGWLANIFIEGHGLGAVGDILFAIAGAFVATFIYSNLSSINHSLSRTVIVSVMGTILFLTPVAIFSTRPKRKTI